MASWAELKGYIASNYKVSEDIGNGVKLEFQMGDGRSQLVFVTNYKLSHSSEDWVVVESPFGELGTVDLNRAVSVVGEMVCGGIGLFMDRYLTLRDAVPLANLDINEFERPLQLISSSADQLEKALTGRDEF